MDVATRRTTPGLSSSSSSSCSSSSKTFHVASRGRRGRCLSQNVGRKTTLWVSPSAKRRRGRGRWERPLTMFTTTKASVEDERGEVKQDMDASNIGQPIDAPINPITAEPLVKGQGTAIVTGVVSVVIAIGYLVLVQVMDSRDMVPPVEAEAYGDGSVSTIEKTTGTSENTNETPVEREMVEM